MSELVERCLMVIDEIMGKDHPIWPHEREEIVRAVIGRLKDLPEEPGPRYSIGDYSRSNIRAFIEDALL